MKITITVDDIRLKSILKINHTFILTKKFFSNNFRFYSINSYPLDNINGFYQLIAGSYKSDQPINITGIDKVQLNCDCVNSSKINGVREPILYSFALDKPAGHKIYNQPRIKLFKKINNSILSHIMFYLEHDDCKPVDFNGETISFTCQLIKIKYSYFLFVFIYKPLYEYLY